MYYKKSIIPSLNEYDILEKYFVYVNPLLDFVFGRGFIWAMHVTQSN